jgi:hypothetical protein
MRWVGHVARAVAMLYELKIYLGSLKVRNNLSYLRQDNIKISLKEGACDLWTGFI